MRPAAEHVMIARGADACRPAASPAQPADRRGGAAAQPRIHRAAGDGGAGRHPRGGVLVLLPEGHLADAAVRLRHAARRSGAGQQPDLVAGARTDGVGPAGRAGAALPARHRRPQAGRGVQGRRSDAAQRAAGRDPGLVRDPGTGRGAGAGGAADRDRQRDRRDRDPAGSQGRAEAGHRGGRRGRQLRRDQHPARVAADRCVPADGGRRAWAGA